MLKILNFENFKPWHGRHQLEFGRITGLFGANSSGKSSIIQLLLLLKQTVEASDSNVVLHFGGGSGDYVDSGSFLDIVTDHDPKHSVSYALSWTQHANPDIEINLSSSIVSIPGSNGEQAVVKRLNYNNYRRPSYRDRGKEWEDSAFVPVMFEGRYGKFVGPASFTVDRSDSGKYNLDVRMQTSVVLKPEDESTKYQPIGLHRFPRNALLAIPKDGYDPLRFFRSHTREEIEEDNRVLLGYTLSEYLREMEDSAEELLRGIRYLGPLRDYPRRNYTWTGVSPTTVGPRGELAIPALLSGDTVTPGVISRWLRKLGLAEDFSLNQIGRGARIWEPMVTELDGGTEVNLADVGFGVSQVLPVIVAMLSAPPGSLVILEHPEIHLHPGAQSNLADLLIDVANAGEIQILVESHSEHLLARIQRRIAEYSRGDGGLAPEDARIFFCEKLQGKSKLTELDLEESGVITNWPDDFFGDILEERMALGGYYPDADDPT